MSKKLASRLALLLCLLTTLVYFSSNKARASDCTDCEAQCRADYDACRAGIDIGQCFVNYEDCLDYTCGPVCGG